MKQANQIIKARKALIALLISVPLFVFLLGNILPEQPSSPMLNDRFWADKIAGGKQYDIVAVGDSRIYRGINPDIISEKLGASVFNFGFSSAGLDSILITDAVKLLKPDGLKILLIGVTPSSFTDEALRNEHFQTLKRINSKDLWIRQNLYQYLTFFNPYSLSDLKKSVRMKITTRLFIQMDLYSVIKYL